MSSSINRRANFGESASVVTPRFLNAEGMKPTDIYNRMYAVYGKKPL